MENDDGKKVDLYIPRKCSATNHLIQAKDHAAIQLNIGYVDFEGRIMPGQFHTIAISGFVRQKGVSDHSINKICTEGGLLKNVVPPSLQF